MDLQEYIATVDNLLKNDSSSSQKAQARNILLQAKLEFKDSRSQQIIKKKLEQISQNNLPGQTNVSIHKQGVEEYNKMKALLVQIEHDAQQSNQRAGQVLNALDEQIERLDMIHALNKTIQSKLERVQKHLTGIVREVQGERCLQVLIGLLILANIGLVLILVIPF